MDLRIEQIFCEEMRGDKSFQEKPTALGLLFGTYNPKRQKELRDVFYNGIKLGIEFGLRRADLDGQKIELYRNTATNEKHKEFLDKFYKLADEYKCAIQYHPKHGMVVISR